MGAHPRLGPGGSLGLLSGAHLLLLQGGVYELGWAGPPLHAHHGTLGHTHHLHSLLLILLLGVHHNHPLTGVTPGPTLHHDHPLHLGLLGSPWTPGAHPHLLLLLQHHHAGRPTLDHPGSHGHSLHRHVTLLGLDPHGVAPGLHHHLLTLLTGVGTGG